MPSGRRTASSEFSSSPSGARRSKPNCASAARSARVRGGVACPARLEALLVDRDERLVQRVDHVDRRGVVVGAAAGAEPVAQQRLEVEVPRRAVVGSARRRARRASAARGRAGRRGTSACPENAASTPASSSDSSTPPSDVTQSTSSSASCSAHAAAKPSSGWRTPVDVSAWTTNRAANGSRAASRSASVGIARPHGASTRVTSAPRRVERVGHPLAEQAVNPADDAVAGGDQVVDQRLHARAAGARDRERDLVVGAERRRAACRATSSISSPNAGSRWPIVGRASASRTRGATGLGPAPSSSRSGRSVMASPAPGSAL